MGIRQIIADDLTGAELPDADSTKQTVKVGSQSYTVYLAADSLAALTEMLSGSGTALLCKLLVPVPAPAASKPTRARSGSGSGKQGEHAAARQWAETAPDGQAWVKAQPAGFKIGTKGRAPSELLAAYRGSQASGSQQSPAPADNPAPAA